LEQQNKDAAYEAAVIKSQNATKLLMADEDEASLLQVREQQHHPCESLLSYPHMLFVG